MDFTNWTGKIVETCSISYMTKRITAENGVFVAVSDKTLLKVKNPRKRYTWQLNGEPGTNTIMVADFRLREVEVEDLPKYPNMVITDHGDENMYFDQVEGAIWISGRKLWNLVSFDPRFAPELQLHICHFADHPASITALQNRLDVAIEKAKGIIRGKE